MTQFRQFERTHFFTGKVLSAEDLTREQQYQIGKRRLQNRFLHGWGVIAGLHVGLRSGPSIVVEPGIAIDCAGNEVVLEAPQTIAIADLVGRHFVVVRYVEVPTGEEVGLEGADYSRVREAACVELSATNPDAHHRGMGRGTPGCGQSHGLCLAVLSQRGSRWRVSAR
jgi:hypothetical protein